MLQYSHFVLAPTSWIKARTKNCNMRGIMTPPVSLWWFYPLCSVNIKKSDRMCPPPTPPNLTHSTPQKDIFFFSNDNFRTKISWHVCLLSLYGTVLPFGNKPTEFLLHTHITSTFKAMNWSAAPKIAWVVQKNDWKLVHHL